MNQKYLDHITNNFGFPQEGFELKGKNLTFHGIALDQLIDKYQTPFKLMYLPKIGEQINKARTWFDQAIYKHNYTGQYHYAYCTKCCHYAPVVKAATKAGAQLETSSSLDVDLIYKLNSDGDITKSTTILHNGYKSDDYLKKIIQLKEDGFKNSILILDSHLELDRAIRFSKNNSTKLKIGIRMAVDESASASHNTSRLGIPKDEIHELYNSLIKDNTNIELNMFHFFVDSGIKNNTNYWDIFGEAVNTFILLKKNCPELSALNIGGGFPIKNNLSFEYNYEGIVDKIVSQIKEACMKAKVNEPNIFTEFGKYTVGESGASIFSVLEQKQQNDSEIWYMVDGSLINTIPDSWTISERFIVLPVNKWSNSCSPIQIGGLSCDDADYYSSEDKEDVLHLPEYATDNYEPLYIGFFHTGAYQDAISGYGGVKHCLIPDPKMVFVDKDEDGNLFDFEHGQRPSLEEKMKILGY